MSTTAARIWRGGGKRESKRRGEGEGKEGGRKEIERGEKERERREREREESVMSTTAARIWRIWAKEDERNKT